MRRPHQNVATALVHPRAVADLAWDLMARDLWVWPIASAPNCPDGPRLAFQVRRRLIESRRGDWDLAAEWTPVWISFGDTWYSGDEPLPWAAHATLWDILRARPEHVRFRLGLTGVPKLAPRRETV